MLYYHRINISEGIDINKTSASKEGDICHYRNFSDNSFQFQADGCNGCHDILKVSIKLNNTAIF